MANPRASASDRRLWFAGLANAIAIHERWFGELAHDNAHSKKLRRFLRDVWDPYFAQWAALQGRISDVDVDLVARLRVGLATVRNVAQHASIPVPELGGQSS